MTINERVKEVRKAKGLTLEEFGNIVGVQKSGLSKVERGENNVSEQMFKSIVREFGVSEAWLRDETGDMFADGIRMEGVRRMVSSLEFDNESFKARLISALSELPESDWLKVEAFCRKLLAEGKAQDTEELLAAHMREGFTADSPEALADIEMIKRIDSGETD